MPYAVCCVYQAGLQLPGQLWSGHVQRTGTTTPLKHSQSPMLNGKCMICNWLSSGLMQCAAARRRAVQGSIGHPAAATTADGTRGMGRTFESLQPCHGPWSSQDTGNVELLASKDSLL